MNGSRAPIDAITLEVLRHAFSAVAEEMNANLIRSAYSPNIKERRDCSSALFDAEGKMIAQAESIPVHLGAMPYSVAAALRNAEAFSPGDIVVLNDPYAGGAHLPDITFVAPVFCGSRLVAFVANRAHHADVGGKEPGSLSGDTVEIFQEGLRIPPVRLWRRGNVDRDLLDLILLNVRTPAERWGDLRAQRAACRTGVERLSAVVERYGVEPVTHGMEGILEYSERRMRAEIAAMPDGKATFSDVLDDDGVSGGPIPIRVAVTIKGDRIAFDFAGTAEQVSGPVNAVLAVTSSATFYAVRAVTDPGIPPNAGCYRPIEIVAPLGTVVNPRPPAPVVGGNLETSQRIVDVILGALGQLIPDRTIAACQGTMNNFAVGGIDPRTGGPYSLYETIAGGFGAGPNRDGADGVHSHMTNTLNTPIEALEIAYPLRVERYELRPHTGGAGTYRGGLGIRRDIRLLGATARVSLLCERRTHRPYGLNGGGAGQRGENVLVRGGDEIALPGKGSVTLKRGEFISFRTRGGGGYGPAVERDPARAETDRREERA
jgi:N-methylhydantoinase B